MTTYVIPTPTIHHVIKAYEYMVKKSVKGIDGSLLQGFIHCNQKEKLKKIKAVYICDNIYDGYKTSGNLLGCYSIIHLEETVTL